MKINKITAFLLLFVVATQFSVVSAQDNGFHDVPDNHLFYKEITELADAGILRGYSDETFLPARPVTRAEAAVMISRVKDLDLNEGSSFPDVGEKHFASSDIESAMLAGYIEGYPDGTFRPNDPLTREQMATILHRVYPFEEDRSDFRDVPENRFSYEAVSALFGARITSGTSEDLFSPGRAILREEMSAFLYRSINWYDDHQEAEREALYEELNVLISTLPAQDEISWSDREQIEKTRYQYQRVVQKNGISSYINKRPLEEAEEALRSMKRERTGTLVTAGYDDVSLNDLLQKTYAYERRFAQNNYRGAIETEENLMFAEGNPNSRILVTLPHPVVHIRNEQPKLAEPYTGALGLLLQEFTGAHVLYVTRETDDVNYYHDVPFKKEMKRITGEYPVDLVLDLHGAARSRDFDVDLGTSRGRLIEQGKTASLMSAFTDKGFTDVFENHTFTASNSGNVANYSSNELGVDAVQVELNRDLRDPRQNEDLFQNTFEALLEFILLYDE